jgi:hypothetical protein
MNIEVMDLLGEERGKQRGKETEKEEGKKLWIFYSQLTYIAQHFSYQHNCQ